MKDRKARVWIITGVLTLIYIAISYYLVLPPINLRAEAFYTYLIGVVIAFCILHSICLRVGKMQDRAVQQTYFTGKLELRSFRNYKIPVFIIAGLAAILILGGIISAPMFNAGRYQKLLAVEDGTFQEDVAQVDYTQIPTLDKESAEKLGDRKMGELADLVSQFEVSNLYTQINYQGRPTRVTPLLYGDFFKWWNNRKEGLPAYMRLDMVTQEVTCVRLDEGIKYSESEYFNRNIKRHLRFQYPTFMLDDPVFEIDEEGNPYWVCTKFKKTIGLFGGRDVDGVVLCNAVTGESVYYADGEIPSWVDRAYSADLLIEQYDYHGMYVHGFFNAIFGQKDAKETTAGYNYVAMNDDIYVYTGVTSLGGDESNIGFVLMNQRTKATKFFAVGGAEEYSAMDSAEGQVQHLQYTATFPLLLNISGQPTYFIPLKDYAGLVKKYSMVNVSQYQIVAIGDTIRECEEAYNTLLRENNIVDGTGNGASSNSELAEISGIIKEIRTAVINGNTICYIKLDSSEKVFRMSASQDETVIMLNAEEFVRIVYQQGETAILKIHKLFREDG